MIEKILIIATPTNEKEIESFLGFMNFCGRYIPKYPELIELFANLRKRMLNSSGQRNNKNLLID